jgi:hypothetical protein
MMSLKATGDVTMTNVKNQDACEMTADELELVSGGGDLGPAAEMHGTEPPSTLESIGSGIIMTIGGLN